jgi:hypothetical protein
MHKPPRTPPAVAIVRVKRKRERRRLSSWFPFLKSAAEADQEARGQLPDLSEDEVLDWADAFFARTGDWPNFKSGPIPEAPGETWLVITAALQFGLRGFSPGGTLARLFAAHRGRYHLQEQQFSIKQILAWADAHHRRTGRWPTSTSGPIREAPDENWTKVNNALRKGHRGHPGGCSLVDLLVKRRQLRTPRRAERLTVQRILGWADAFHDRTGRWPTQLSGPIPEAPGENWAALTHAVARGTRGLPGGSTLTRLLVEHRGIKCRKPPILVNTERRRKSTLPRHAPGPHSGPR